MLVKHSITTSNEKISAWNIISGRLTWKGNVIDIMDSINIYEVIVPSHLYLIYDDLVRDVKGWR